MSRINLEDSILERPLVRTGMKHGITILGDANQTLDADMGPVLLITPTAGRTFTLPAVDASMRGLTFYVITQAAFAITVRTATPTTVGIVPATIGATGMFVCTGNAAAGSGGIEGWIGGL
jgi:hypothetical protein